MKICTQKFELIDFVKIESSLSFKLCLKILNKRFTLIEVLEILEFFPLTKKYLFPPQKVIQILSFVPFVSNGYIMSTRL